MTSIIIAVLTVDTIIIVLHCSYMASCVEKTLISKIEELERRIAEKDK